MDTLFQDLRYAARRLLKSPGFTAIVVLTLALGIGANTAIFSVVDTVLLKALPYRDPGQLVTIEHYYPSLNKLQAPVSVPGFRDYRDKTHSFAAMAVESNWAPALTGMGDPQRLSAAGVTADFFRVLGVAALRGRPIAPGEDQKGHDRVVVLSHATWQRLFGGRPDAVGQRMTLDGESYEVVGIMPADFKDFWNGRDVELWAPLSFAAEDFSDNRRTNEWLNLTARLKPGVTVETARAEMRAFAEQLKKDYVDQYPRDWSLVVTPLAEKQTGNIRPALLVLLGAVGFVLLIACANVANLLLARAASRLKEVAIRTALGAKRGQLIRQLLTESLLLSLTGGAVGLLLAYWGVKAVKGLDLRNIPRVDELSVDGRVLAFTVLVALVTGVLFGLVPALQTSRSDLQSTLREGGRSATADRGGQTVRRALVVTEMALALTLLVGAGLLIRSFSALQRVDPGFDPKHLLVFSLALPETKYRSDTARVAFYDDLLPPLRAIPGVRAAGAIQTLPFSGWSTGSFTVEGYQAPEGQPGPWGDQRWIDADYFKAMRITLLKGRAFTEQDGPGAPLVAVVDEEMVKRFWPNENPIGKRLRRGGDKSPWIEVVGVVRHATQEALDAEHRVQLYRPFRQAGIGFLSFAVRADGDPLALAGPVRATVKQLDRDLPIIRLGSMEERLDASVGQRRFSTLLLGLFAAIAMLLACIGIYGVMSYMVTQRQQELGVRMALGAARGSVLGLVMRQGMSLALLGIVLGLAGAFWLTRLMTSQLFDVKATDPVTFGGVALLLTTVAVVAILLPAMRATRVDPVVALRNE